MFVTNRSDPDTAMPSGPFNPEMSDAFTIAPDVVYSPIVPSRIRDKQVRSGHRDANGAVQPRDQRCVHAAPDVVYSPIVPEEVRDKQIRTGHRNARRHDSAPRSAMRSRLRPTLCIRQSSRDRSPHR